MNQFTVCKKAIESVSKDVTDQTVSARNFSSNMVTLSNGMTNFSENISEFEEAILAVSQTDEEAKKLIPKLIMKIMGKRQVSKSNVSKLKSFMMVLKIQVIECDLPPFQVIYYFLLLHKVIVKKKEPAVTACFTPFTLFPLILQSCLDHDVSATKWPPPQ